MRRKDGDDHRRQEQAARIMDQHQRGQNRSEGGRVGRSAWYVSLHENRLIVWYCQCEHWGGRMFFVNFSDGCFSILMFSRPFLC